MLASKLSSSVGTNSASANYIEDVFSTYLYAGSSTTPQTITNGIDLSTKGGLVWTKKRDAAGDHALFDTARGSSSVLYTNLTVAADTGAPYNTSFNTNGFTFNTGNFHDSGYNYASWTFRKQPKFFDVVTYTGNGATSQTIAHNLQSKPGCVIIKRTDSTGSWWTICRDGTNTVVCGNVTAPYQPFALNSTNAAYASGVSDSFFFNSTSFFPYYFSGAGTDGTNVSGATYVAYLFAHNAGGFGLTGTDNVISCGSASTDASGNFSVNLGYEPQWVLWKNSSATGIWELVDNMRDFSVTNNRRLFPNLSNAESASTGGPYLVPNATGFSMVGSSGPVNGTVIYIAIRRGPMKVPTSGTSVFSPTAYAGNSASGRVITTGNLPDLTITKARDNGFYWPVWFDRLRGGGQIQSNNTDGELAQSSNVGGYVSAYNNLSYVVTSGSSGLASVNAGWNYINYAFSRAPNFFDEICWASTGSSTTQNHNLGVAPELVITKIRGPSAGSQWYVDFNFGATTCNEGLLNQTGAAGNYAYSIGTAVAAQPTTTQLQFYAFSSGYNYVSYLFASCPGVSKVGSYTGTGATQTISCGFTGGARFVLIKRTDSTGDWYYWDTARGMVSGTDPNLQLNTTNNETNTNSIYTATGGFQIVSTAAGINASGGSYIFLAVS